MSQYVFICHATEDKAVATAICETLEASGVPCWIAPRNIKPGADYGGAIIKAIGEARALVLVLSTHSNESEHVKREVERAVSRGVSVIPFRIEEILPSEALEYFISTTQWVDAFTPPLEKHVGYLAENLKELVPPEAKEVKVAEPEPLPPPRAAAPQAKSWFLTVPGLVTIAAAGVLVVAGLLGGLYLADTFSRSEKPVPPEAPAVAVVPPTPEKKVVPEKALPEKAAPPKAPEIVEKAPVPRGKAVADKAPLEQVLNEEKEPNEHIRDANLIALGNPVQGRLTTENDRDWYKFKTGPASSKVRVIVRKQFGVVINVYDQTEYMVKSEVQGFDKTISIAWESAPNSYYYVLVKSYGEKGTYELEVREEGG
ncbi:MAG: TIR domain-containing protein [Desulfomonile tiedjei]|nr:TIR domain-containing protein [Desulfomonile tiedjei]